MARRDIVLLVVILALLPRGASQLTAMLASSTFPSVYIGLGSWLIGFIAGIRSACLPPAPMWRRLAFYGHWDGEVPF